MKKASYKTTTFETGYENFMIDITEYTETFPDGTKEEMYGSWLYRKNMGIKEFIVGEFKKYYPNISVPEYAKHILDYCCIVWDTGNGKDSFDWYDEQYQ